ncbi:MAG TPA: hypothetical protein VL357_13470 [Rariglobus sp.]|nr:hypothetical protein [Rariglobus sp.]
MPKETSPEVVGQSEASVPESPGALPPLEETDAPVPSGLKPLPVMKLDSPPSQSSITGALGGATQAIPFRPPVKASRLSIGRIMTVVVLLVLLAGAGYYAYRTFLTAPPAPSPAPPAIVKVPPVPSVAPAPAPLPVVPDNTVKPAVVEPQVPVAVLPKKPVLPPVPVVPLPSVDFLTWVDSAKISGVFNGSSPRAIVNGLLVRPGDTIDANRGIVFDHLDPVMKQFFFRDRTGALASKAY